MARSDDAATTSSSGGSGGGSGSATSGTTGSCTKSASSTASVASRSLLSIRRSSLFNNKTNSKTMMGRNAAAASDLTSSTLRAAAAASSAASPAEAEAASGTLTTSTSGAGFAFGFSLRRRSSTTSSPIDAPQRVELSHRPKTSSASPVATPLNSWNPIIIHGPQSVGASTAADAPRHTTTTARTRSMSPNEPTGPATTNHRMQQDLTTTFAPSFAASSSLSSSNAHAHALVNQPSFIRPPHTASALGHDTHSSAATLPKAANKQHPPSSNWTASPVAAASAIPEPSTSKGALSSSSNTMSTSAMHHNNTSKKPLEIQINTASRSPLPSASGPSPLSATKSSALAPMTTTATRPLSNSNSSSRRGEPTLPHDKVARAPATSMYWSRTPVSGRLPRPMRAHTAVVVDTSIYCFGGCDLKGVCFRDVWKLDGDSFLWSKVKVLGDIPPVTRAHTSTVVGSRIWVIAGGDGPNYSNSVYYFETTSHEWVRPKVYGPTPTKRRAHAAVLYGSRIIIFGGGNGSNALQDVHSLDVLNHYRPTWSELQVRGPKPVRRGYHSMTLVGSKAIVFGGSDGTECFSDMFVLDLEALTWTEVIPESPTPVSPTKTTSNVGPAPRTEAFPRLSHSATLLGSYLVIFGGHDGIDFSNELLFFNLVSLQWEPRSAHGHAPSPRGYHTCVLHDSRLLCIGGFDGKQVFDECYSLDLGALAFLPQVTQFKLDVYSDQEDEEERERREESG